MLLGSGNSSPAKIQPAGQGMLAGKVTNSSGGLSESGIEAELPETFMLFQNYPNPFNPATTIQFALAEPGEVELTIYSLTGQKVKTLARGFVEAGYYTMKWDGSDASGNPAASGIYVYQLTAGDRRFAKKMVLIK